MSGKIELKIRKSQPKIKNGIQLRPDIKYYPGWIWRVYQEKDYGSFDEDNFVELMPSYAQLKKAFKEMLIHELQVDLVMGNRTQFRKWKDFVEKELPALSKEIDVNQSGIPDVIRDCKK